MPKLLPAEFKAARHKLGLTVEQMAAFVGVEARTIRRWEADPERDSTARPPHPSACVLVRLALKRPEIILEAITIQQG